MNPRYCSHVLKYEKKSNKITWLRCINCNSIIGWLEDDRKKIEGKVVRLSNKEKELLR
jgi:alkylated DNA nucleotide flippase Atl1